VGSGKYSSLSSDWSFDQSGEYHYSLHLFICVCLCVHSGIQKLQHNPLTFSAGNLCFAMQLQGFIYSGIISGWILFGITTILSGPSPLIFRDNK